MVAMKRLSLFIVLGILVFTLLGCDQFLPNADIDPDPNPIDDPNNDPNDFPLKIVKDQFGSCDEGMILMNDNCIDIDVLTDHHLNIRDETIERISEGVSETLDDLVADLSNSTGLAVIPKEIFVQQQSYIDPSLSGLMRLNMVTLNETEDDTENVIVKLTEEGFFEEVSFSDSSGHEVTITSNPIVLEVYGPFTVVFFDVIDNWWDVSNLHDRIWQSLQNGGIFIIHNETGKVFATTSTHYETFSESHVEYLDYEVHTTITVGEPVTYELEEPLYDEEGNPVIDENGNQVTGMVTYPLLDYDGNPVIITESILQTVLEEVSIFETVDILRVDEEGNAILDEEGNPIYDTETIPLLDEEGNPVKELTEVALLDEEGNPIYLDTYEMTFNISEEITHTIEYRYAVVEPGPLHELARRFTEDAINEYYNWNYYRTNDYMIQHHQFAFVDEELYYLEGKDINDQMEYIIMKLSFDYETNELLLEEYLNTSKAGLNECELMIDPVSKNIICNQWDDNLIIFSDTIGLKTLEDTGGLYPVFLPNGEVFFTNQWDKYDETLGYHTKYLYTINDLGEIIGVPIELGEREFVCAGGTCIWPVELYTLNEEGERNTFPDININVLFDIGESLIEEATMVVDSVVFEENPDNLCLIEEGCNYPISYSIYDGEALIAHFTKYVFKNYLEPAPISEYIYLIDETTDIRYDDKYVTEQTFCDNETLGCKDNFGLYDPNISSSLNFYFQEIVGFNDSMLTHINVLEDNQGEYIYTADFEGEMCLDGPCTKQILAYVYDQAGEQIARAEQYITVGTGEQMPLYVAYQITEDTLLETYSDVCNDTTCTWAYLFSDGTYYYIDYDYGDTIYSNITFAETDKTFVYQETRTRETCTEFHGCQGGSIIFTIKDGETVLYTFETETWIDYGDTLPFYVNLSLSDVEIEFQSVGSIVPRTCEETSCYKYISLYQKDGSNEIFIEATDIILQYGDLMIQSIYLSEQNVPIESTEPFKCMNPDGCYYYTKDAIFEDTLGNRLNQEPFGEYFPGFEVVFDYLDPIPVGQSFTITFTITDFVYRYDRLSSYRALGDEMVMLEEDVYLVHSNAWGDYKTATILRYLRDENRYIANASNMPRLSELTPLGNGYIGINNDKTAILYIEFDETLSHEGYMHYTITNLTEGLMLNVVNNIIIDYDGSIYFNAVDNQIQDITGTITPSGEVIIDTTYTEREVVRLRPIN